MNINSGGMKRLSPSQNIKEDEPNSINDLPNEVLLDILFKTDYESIVKSLQISKRIYLLNIEQNLLKKIIFSHFAFSPPHWNRLVKDNLITNEECLEAFQYFPDNIHELIRKIKNHCMLFYIPKKLTINLFKEFLTTKKLFTEDLDKNFGESFKDEIKSGWVIMTKEVLPQTCFKTLEIQAVALSNFNLKQSLKYTFPEMLGTIIGLYTEYLKSGKFHLEYTFTRCIEFHHHMQVHIGKPNSKSISYGVHSFWNPFPIIGLIAYHRFNST